MSILSLFLFVWFFFFLKPCPFPGLQESQYFHLDVMYSNLDHSDSKKGGKEWVPLTLYDYRPPTWTRQKGDHYMSIYRGHFLFVIT